MLRAAAVCLYKDNANAAGDVPANSRFLTRASPEFGMTRTRINAVPSLRTIQLNVCPQKLNVACKSILRTATPVEKGPPCRLLYLSKNGEPKTPPGFPRFTLLKIFRPEALSVKL